MLGLFQRLQVLAMAVSVVPAVLCAQASDTKDKATFAAGDRKATFGFDWRNGMIFIPVRLNGSRPLSFVLDTGSTKMIVDRALATSLGLKAGGSGSLQGAGAGRIPVEFIHNVSIALPGIESTGYEFSTADLQPLETSLGVRVDGILGYELFSRFVVTVDYEAKTMTLNSPGAFPISNAAQEIPIELRDKWAFVKAELVFPGSVTVQDAFLIDTGSSDAVDHPIVMKLENRVPATSGVGLGAQIQGATARATSFRLGRYSITAPTVSCCGASDATSKLIGNEVLQRFTVIFDYPSSRIFIEPNSHVEKPLRPTN
jgi:hypothetical protein